MSLIDDILSAALPAPLKSNFGDSVTYTHRPGGTVQTVTAIITDTVPESAYPGKILLMEFSTADLSPAAVQGDEVTYSGSTYKVADVKTDPPFAMLSLRKSA